MPLSRGPAPRRPSTDWLMTLEGLLVWPNLTARPACQSRGGPLLHGQERLERPLADEAVELIGVLSATMALARGGCLAPCSRSELSAAGRASAQ